MKQKIFLVIFVLSGFITQSQTSNIVTASEFDGFNINDITLSDINKTAGKQSLVEKLLGVVASFSTDENESYHYFKFNGLSIDFSMASKNKPYIESYEINGSEFSLTIKNVTITVGDNINKLGNPVFSVGRNGAKSILYTVCEDCDSFVNIEFDQTTNIITKISYMDMS